MRILGKTFAYVGGFLMLLIVGTVAWVKLIAYPDYSYRYRLTLTIEVDGKVYTGSSVIEVIWHGGIPFTDVGPYYPSIRGQATLVNLDSHGAIVASLTNGAYGRAPDGTYSAIWIAARAFGNQSTNKELRSLPRLTGRRHLASDNLPSLIWFRDISNPNTARTVLPSEIPQLFGPGARLVSIAVEITDDPVVIDLDKKLPWYNELETRQKSTGIVGRPNEFQLSYLMFIGA